MWFLASLLLQQCHILECGYSIACDETFVEFCAKMTEIRRMSEKMTEMRRMHKEAEKERATCRVPLLFPQLHFAMVPDNRGGITARDHGGGGAICPFSAAHSIKVARGGI
jgi:hypothetical protein